MLMLESSLLKKKQANTLADLDRKFKSEKTMEAALSLRRQELALPKVMKMEQRVVNY